MELTFEELGKLFLRFRKSRYFRAFYLVILGLVVTGLFAFTGGSQVTACLGILLIPVAVLVLPYWLGERSLKNFSINALPVFAIALVLIAALQTNAMLTQGPPALTSPFDPTTANTGLPHLTLWNGTVDPYRGAPDQVFTFHVRLKTVNATGGVSPSPASVTISANLSQYDIFLGSNDIIVPMRVDTNQTDTSNGTWYVGEKALPSAVYGFYFWANDTTGNSTYSGFVLEPLNSPTESYYAFWSVYTLFDLIFPVSFYFIIVFMYWYTIRTRRMRERMMERSRGEKLDLKKGTKGGETGEGGASTPPAAAAETGKTKKVAAFTCTNCGADVTEDDEKCPKCGAVFED